MSNQIENGNSPDQQHSESFLRRHPKVMAVTASIGALGAAGALVVVGVNALKDEFAEYVPHQTISPDDSRMQVEVSEFKAIDLNCRATAVATVKPDEEGNPSGLRSVLAAKGKSIPGTGYASTITGTADLYACFDGAFMKTEVDQDTGEQVVTADWEGFKTIAEWQEKEVVTELPTVSSLGGVIGSITKFVGGLTTIERISAFDNYINVKEAEFGELTEDYALQVAKTKCLDIAKEPLEETLEAGILLSAKNQGINPGSVTVEFTGDWETYMENEAGKPLNTDFDITEDSIETNCTVKSDASAVTPEDIAEYLTVEQKTTQRKQG